MIIYSEISYFKIDLINRKKFTKRSIHSVHGQYCGVIIHVAYHPNCRGDRCGTLEVSAASYIGCVGSPRLARGCGVRRPQRQLGPGALRLSPWYGTQQRDNQGPRVLAGPLAVRGRRAAKVVDCRAAWSYRPACTNRSIDRYENGSMDKHLKNTRYANRNL